MSLITVGNQRVYIIFVKINCIMEKLFRSFFAMVAVVTLAFILPSCGHEDPVPATVGVSGVSLNKTSLNLLEGGSETLTATVAPDNATNKSVSWKSSDNGVATVDNSGKVTAVKATNGKTSMSLVLSIIPQVICLFYEKNGTSDTRCLLRR